MVVQFDCRARPAATERERGGRKECCAETTRHLVAYNFLNKTTRHLVTYKPHYPAASAERWAYGNDPTARW